jgi:hypothetical protein
MNIALYPRKELTFELIRKKVDSGGTTAVSYIVFVNTSSGHGATVRSQVLVSEAPGCPSSPYFLVIKNVLTALVVF